MDIKWSSLGEVALVSLGVSVGIVVIFAIGVLAWSPRTAPGDAGDAGDVGDARHARHEGAAAAPNPPFMKAAAGLCFFACALIVGYGIYLIVPQFH